MVIEEKYKIMFARLIIKIGITDDERKHINWTTYYFDWARSDECGKYIERIKRMKAFL